MPKLDIIITHYKEPWEIGKKLFDMIGAQQGISFDDISVYLIHDGSDFFPCENFRGYPFNVTQHTIPHAGVSAARNAGLDLSCSPWVMFCDFDDMFSNAFSLYSVIPLLSDDYDLLWGDFWSIDKSFDGTFKVTQRGMNCVFIHAKFFRREYLDKAHIRFDTDLEFNEDCLFATTVIETLPANRIGKITTNFPLYVWCFTPNSATSTEDNWWRACVGGYKRNRKVCELFKTEKEPVRYHTMCARLIWDAYFSFNLVDIPDEFRPLIEDFRQFYKEHKEIFWSLDPKNMVEVWDIAFKQFKTWEEESEHRWHSVPMRRRESVNIYQWLKLIEDGKE